MPYEEYAEWQFEARTGYSKAEWKRKKRRPKPRFTLAEIAKQTGYSPAYINDRERALPHRITGEPVQPGRDYIEKIASVTGANAKIGRRLAGWSETDDIPTVQEMKDIFYAQGGIIVDRNRQNIITALSPEAAEMVAKAFLKMVQSSPDEVNGEK